MDPKFKGISVNGVKATFFSPEEHIKSLSALQQ